MDEMGQKWKKMGMKWLKISQEMSLKMIQIWSWNCKIGAPMTSKCIFFVYSDSIFMRLTPTKRCWRSFGSITLGSRSRTGHKICKRCHQYVWWGNFLACNFLNELRNSLSSLNSMHKLLAKMPLGNIKEPRIFFYFQDSPFFGSFI